MPAAVTTELWVRPAFMPYLKGEQVRLLPFAEMAFPAGTIFRLWELARENQALPYLFWTDQATTPEARGSLKYFLDYFETKACFVVFQLDPPALLGLVWFQHVVGRHKGDIGIFLARKTPRSHAIEAGVLALDWVFRAWGWHAVYAVTPWRHARDLCLAVGAELVATVPGYHYERGRARPVYVLRALAPGQEG